MDKVELTPRQLKQLAYDVAVIVAQKMRDLRDVECPELVTTEEAAQILGISAGRLRKIKDRFDYVKQGGQQQGKLLFRRDSLLKSYTNNN